MFLMDKFGYTSGTNLCVDINNRQGSFATCDKHSSLLFSTLFTEDKSIFITFTE
jgi:hypothetical protein